MDRSPARHVAPPSHRRAELVATIDPRMLADRIQRETAEEVAFYAEIDDAQRLLGMGHHCRAHANAVLTAMREGRVPSPAELDFVHELASRRARELNPLSALLHAYRVGYRATWESVVEAVARTDADRELLVELSQLALGYFEAISSEATLAFNAERERAAATTSTAHAELVERLLTGAPTVDDDATRLAAFGLSAHRGAQVVLVALVGAPDERLPGLAVLLSRALTSERGVGLVASRHGRVVAIVESDGGDRREAIASAVRVAARAAELRVHAGIGMPCNELAGVPRSHEEAARALLHTDPERPIRALMDVPLFDELLRAADSITRRRRPPWVTVLRRETELLDTLSAFVAHDCHHGRTADALGVHTNTVRHRLQRIATISGHDLSGFAGLAEVVIAVRLFAG